MKKSFVIAVLSIFIVGCPEEVEYQPCQPGESLPSIAVREGKVIVVWEDHRGDNYEIYAKYSADGGTSWSGDDRVTESVLDSRYVSVALDEDGDAYIAFMEGNNQQSRVFLMKGTAQLVE